MASLFTSFIKTVAASGTPEALGAATVQFNTALLVGRKSETELNTGIVTLQYTAANDSGIRQIYPGNIEQVVAPLNSVFNASQFFLDVAVAGDGVLFVYMLADPKAFNNVERKAEKAMVAYILTIAASLDDCSVTGGISDLERTRDNIHCFVSGGSEAVHNTGLWSITCAVVIRTRAARNDALEKHSVRTAYVRDLFMDDDAAEILSALERDFSVIPRSIRDRAIESGVDGDFWVTQHRFVMTACGSTIL